MFVAFIREAGSRHEIDRAEMRRRLELARQHTMMMGGYGGGCDTRYGYTLCWQGEQRVFAPDPVEYPILRRMVSEREQGKDVEADRGRPEHGQNPDRHRARQMVACDRPAEGR